VNPFAETSFLCALYREDVFSEQAEQWIQAWQKPLPVSMLVLFEFRQSIRLHTRLIASNSASGLTLQSAKQILRNQEEDLRAGVLAAMSVDWPGVHEIAEQLSEKYTWEEGHRFADILHVATALHLNKDTFLTFDKRQGQLAHSEGLDVPFSDDAG